MRSLAIGATGMQTQQVNVETISNNIANMNTTAYSRRRAEFSDLLYQNLRRPGSRSSDQNTIVPAGIQLGLGAKTTAVYRISTPGSLVNTGQPLDLAISGKGYFQIQTPNGETAYTRDGSFQLSATGEIVTHDGYTVLPGIVVPVDTTEITVDATGQVAVKIDNQTNQQIVGQLQLSVFPNEAGLEAVGQNLLLETEASGAPVLGNPGGIGFGRIEQAYLETSNVNVVSEMTDLISAQRAYEMNSKVIQTTDQMMAVIGQLK